MGEVTIVVVCIDAKLTTWTLEIRYSVWVSIPVAESINH